MKNHSSILAWKNPMDRGAWEAQPRGSARVRHNWIHTHTRQNTLLSLNFKSCPLERECQEVTDSDKECLLGVTPHGCLRTPSCGSCESCRACLYAVPGQLWTSLRRYRRCKFLQLHVNGHRGPRASRARGLPRWSKWEGRTTPEQYRKGTYTRGAG